MLIRLRHGYDLRLDGAPAQEIDGNFRPRHVALDSADHPGLALELIVKAGDRVAAGEAVMRDRRDPAIVVTSFLSGTIATATPAGRHHGARVTIAAGGDAAVCFARYDLTALGNIDPMRLRSHLLRTGTWTALRARPGERIARPDIRPRAIYVTAIDTRPLAPDPATVLGQQSNEFEAGTLALSRLTDGDVIVCAAPGADIPESSAARVRRVDFEGPHPAGLPGTHIHATGPAIGPRADLWHVPCQEVAALGHLLLHGTLQAKRVVSLAGDAARRPRLVMAPVGAELSAFAQELAFPAGVIAAGSPLAVPVDRQYLGRFDSQVCLFRERRADPANTVMLPLEHFDRVWPYSSPPAALLRALLTDDIDTARRLGCLGLAEDDLSLCRLACSGDNDYGAALRRTLDELVEEA